MWHFIACQENAGIPFLDSSDHLALHVMSATLFPLKKVALSTNKDQLTEDELTDLKDPPNTAVNLDGIPQFHGPWEDVQ